MSAADNPLTEVRICEKCKRNWEARAESRWTTCATCGHHRAKSYRIRCHTCATKLHRHAGSWYCPNCGREVDR